MRLHTHFTLAILGYVLTMKRNRQILKSWVRNYQKEYSSFLSYQTVKVHADEGSQTIMNIPPLSTEGPSTRNIQSPGLSMLLVEFNLRTS